MSIVDRIEAELGAPGLASRLAQLTPSDLSSLLLDVMRQRALATTLPELLAPRPLLAPSTADARRLAELDRIALATAHEFEALALSPVAPLGANFVLGGIDQHNALAALRNTQALADPTTSLALESARRRKSQAARAGVLRFATSARCIRLQPVDVPGFTPHFQLFALTSAGRALASADFEHAELRRHIAFYLRLLRALNQAGLAITEPTVALSDPAVIDASDVDRAALRERVRAHRLGEYKDLVAGKRLTPTPRLTAAEAALFPALATEFPEARFAVDLERLEGVGYYSGLTLRLTITAPSGARFPIADGGFVDWTQRLLSDHKERLLTTGIGTELLCKLF